MLVAMCRDDGDLLHQIPLRVSAGHPGDSDGHLPGPGRVVAIAEAAAEADARGLEAQLMGSVTRR